MRFSFSTRYLSAAVILSAALAAVHCGSSTGQPSGAQGAANGNSTVANGNDATASSITVSGHQVDTTHAGYFVTQGGSPVQTQTIIRLGSSAALCTPSSEYSDQSLVQMVINTPAALPAATYNVVSLAAATPGIGQATTQNPASFLAQLFNSDGNDSLCSNAADVTTCAGLGTAGQIVISNSGDGNTAITGTYTVTVGNSNEQVSGKFDATYCPGHSTAPTPTPSDTATAN